MQINCNFPEIIISFFYSNDINNITNNCKRNESAFKLFLTVVYSWGTPVAGLCRVDLHGPSLAQLIKSFKQQNNRTYIVKNL